MTDPFELLRGADAPRPLAVALRERLEQQLLGGAGPRPLDDELAARLATELTDPVAHLLAGLDAPRPLAAAVRAAVLARLPAAPTHRRRTWVAAAAVGAAAAAAAVVVIVTGPSPTGRLEATRQPTPSTAPSASVGAGSPALLPPPPASTSAVRPPASGTAGLPATSAKPATASASSAPGSSSPGSGSGAVGGSGGGGATLTAVSPDAGRLTGGTTVRLRGDRLITARRVDFGGVAGTDLRIRDDGSITVVTPARSAPGAVDVVVTLRDGSRATRAAAFHYLAPPRVDSLSPSSGPAGGGTWVTVSGSGLRRATAVAFADTRAATVEVLSDTQLRVLSPPRAPGPADVTVSTAGGTSAGVRYLYLP